MGIETSLLVDILREDDVVIDVGAHVGEFTFAASELVSRGIVHAFEPQRRPFEMLRGSVGAFTNVSIHHAGLSDQVGRACLHIPRIRGKLSRREASLDPHFNDYTGPERQPKAGGSSAETIRLSTLDAFCGQVALDRVDLIKIDVEGHELRVLQGGRTVIERFHPLLMIEIFPYVYEGHLQKVCTFLAEYGYAAYVVPQGKAHAERLSIDNVTGNPGFNYIFAAHERRDRLASILEAAIEEDHGETP